MLAGTRGGALLGRHPVAPAPGKHLSQPHLLHRWNSLCLDSCHGRIQNPFRIWGIRQLIGQARSHDHPKTQQLILSSVSGMSGEWESDYRGGLPEDGGVLVLEIANRREAARIDNYHC